MGVAGERPPDESIPQPAGGFIRLEAHAVGQARVHQAGRDQHFYYRDGVHGARRVEPGTTVQECPYPGLAAFGREQARWFFGRDQLTAKLIARLDDRLRGGGVQMVVAPSGAGKSSLLQAGLLPELRNGALPGSSQWSTIMFTPTAHPLAALATHLAALTGADPATLAEKLAAGSPSSGTVLRQTLLEWFGGEDAGVWLVVVVDQFEELFTLCPNDQHRRAFIELLSQLAGPPSRTEEQRPVALVVVGVRADFYAACANYPHLRTALEDNQLVVGPMSDTELREAILYPAQDVGLDVEAGLVELLLRDLGDAATTTGESGMTGYEAGRLPLLAHALRATWQQRHGHTLTVDGYRSTGGIHRAVAITAENVFTGLDLAGQHTARPLFLRLIKIGDGTEDTRRRMARADLLRGLDAGAVLPVVDAFTRGRLLTQERDTVEITHEALLRAWPRLRQWINTDRAGNLIRQELEEAATVWDRDRRDPAVLYRGSRLETIRSWLNTTAHAPDLSPVANDFVAASTRQETRVKRRRRNVIVALFVLALLATIAAIVAFQQRATAQAQRDDAVLRQVSADATRLRSTDPSLAAKLNLVVYRMRQIPNVYTRDPNVYLGLVAGTYTPLITLSSDRVESIAYSLDGRILAIASDSGNEINGTIRLWNVGDSAHPTLSGQLTTTSYIRSTAFSPDGRILASGNGNAKGDGTIQLWNVTDPAHPTALGLPLAGAANCPDNINGAYNGCVIFSMAYSPDGRTLASGNGQGTIWLWNVTDPTHPTPLPQLTVASHTYSVVFSPDGRTLASGGVDGTVRLWNVTDPTHPTPLAQLAKPGYVTSVAFSPDGRTLASGSTEPTIRLWNVTDPAHPTPLPPLTGHLEMVSSVAFSPDRHTLASVGRDAIRFWNVTDQTHPAPLGELTIQNDVIGPVVFSPDGRTLASAGNTVGLWEMNLDQAIRKICATSGNLTRQQWQQYIPDLPYNPPCA